MDLRRRWRQSAPGAIGVAVTTSIAPILATYANEAMPIAYLFRPVAVAAVVAVGLGALAGLAGRWSLVVAFALSIVAFVPGLWPVVLIALGAEAIIQLVQRVRRRPRPTVGVFTRTAMAILLILGFVRLVPLALGELAVTSVTAADRDRPPIYLILLDGYPREDTLTRLGIDNADFLAGLEKRGFDYYPNASSAHGYTDLVLGDLLTGKPVGPDDDDPVLNSPGWRQQHRVSLIWPADFLILDPPIGHVTLPGGEHWRTGVVTDLEAYLIGRSIAGVVARDWAAELIVDSLAEHRQATLGVLMATDASSVFAHLMAPHPPFLVEGLPDCWPHRCDAFSSWTEKTGLSITEWAGGMRRQIRDLDRDLLGTVDAIVSRRPDAVVVLFSDHGGRYSLAARDDEWHKSFLAARTPGHPALFDEEPHPDAVLRLMIEAYR